MPIENRNLEPGTRLVARYKKEDRTCEVVETADGLRYRLDDGTEHKSPSSAGKAATGGACNGWVFWSLEGTEKPKREPKVEPKAKAAKPAKEPAAKKPNAKKPAAKKSGTKSSKSKKAKAMRAAAKTDASYGCGACGAEFPTQKDAIDHAMTHTS
jgi:hypothetical protein